MKEKLIIIKHITACFPWSLTKTLTVLFKVYYMLGYIYSIFITVVCMHDAMP